MEKCPLCGSAVTLGRCVSCGYASPSEASVAAPYNYDPSDYNSPPPEQTVPKQKPDIGMMEGISADSVNMMDYVNGSGAVNVGDGQYSVLNSPEYQDAGAQGYSRSNPAPYITKDTSLQEDMMNFYAERARQGMNANMNAGMNAGVGAGGNVSGSYNANPAGNRNIAGGNIAQNTAGDPSNPYANFDPAQNSANSAPSGNPYAGLDPTRNPLGMNTSANPLKNVSLPSFEDTTDYSSLNTSEKVVKKTVNFVIRHGWQFILLFIAPSLGVIIGSVYFLKYRFSTERKMSDIILGIVFFLAALFLKFQRIDPLGIDGSIWRIIEYF